MTITLTPLTRSQWFKVIAVFFWLAVSTGFAALTAWLAKDKTWLATMPAYNLALVVLKQIFQQEEDSAVSQLPPVQQAEVKPLLQPPVV